jgi:CRISPR system Cascade subunit CasA
MNLLEDPWIPVRELGASACRVVTYRELLCEARSWQVSLPRDDLELACIQLLVCMTQVMFLPADDRAWRERISRALSHGEFAASTAPFSTWFDLDHPSHPFMQTRGVDAKEVTPIQKLLVGLPEGNNHAFFNEVGEARRIGGAVAAIALFNQACNAPSFGGGFKGSLRGGSPITTLVVVPNGSLRETVWLNVLTRDRVLQRLPGWSGHFERDKPTWLEPIAAGATIHWNEIGLARGLFWQPAIVELVRGAEDETCDVIDGAPVPVYIGFRKKKFGFSVEGLWPHPHGAMVATLKSGKPEWRFSSFTTSAPAWTRMSEFVVPRSIDGEGVKEGSVPAGPVAQAAELGHDALHLLVGGYRTNQASIIQRRHDLMSLAQGWNDAKGRLQALVEIGKEIKTILRGKLYAACQGDRRKGLKGIGAPLHETGEKLYYARTERLIHETFSNEQTFREWIAARTVFVERLAVCARGIFDELTDPYAMKPDLIPVIASTRRGLHRDLARLKEAA